MDLIYTSMFAMAFLCAAILLLVMWGKSFKYGGVITGLIGVLTGGLYTYAWGWLKAKQHQLVKPMLLWSVCLILAGALVYVTGPIRMLSAVPFDIGQKQLVRFFGTQKVVANKTGNKPAGNTVRKKIVAPQPDANDALKNPDWNTRAVSLWRQTRFADSQQAVSFLQKAIQEDPGFAEAYNNRGNAFRDMQDYDRAMQDYNKALSLNPELEQTYNNRGNIFYDQRNYQMAIRDYNKALSLNADYPLAYLNRGLAYRQLKNDDLACRDFAKACELGECEGIQWAKRIQACQ